MPAQNENSIFRIDVSLNYSARAVLYTAADSGGDEARFRILDFSQDPAVPMNAARAEAFLASASLEMFAAEGAGYLDLNSLVVHEDGTVTASLNDAGRNALAAAGGANVYDYITFTAGGSSYTMQVVVNQDGFYSSAEEDALNPSYGGYYYGEWHSETDFTTADEEDYAIGDHRATGAAMTNFGSATEPGWYLQATAV